jgi:hypothetical protein
VTGKKVLETAHHPTEHDKAEMRRRYRSGEYPLIIALDLDVSPEDLERVLKISLNHCQEYASSRKSI